MFAVSIGLWLAAGHGGIMPRDWLWQHRWSGLAGAFVLSLLSFAAHHLLAYPDNPSPGVVLYVALFTWFVCDYLALERSHLYTYDLVAERLGFKLVWVA
ncbi:MAG: hypothetical protein OXH52_11235 [Gammaproteobacteria bacterium]|nr:hypothetical protein [Gammaproteobacteria bacterium]